MGQRNTDSRNPDRKRMIDFAVIAVLAVTLILVLLFTHNTAKANDSNVMGISDQVRVSVYDGITSDNAQMFADGNENEIVAYGSGKIKTILASNNAKLSPNASDKIATVLKKNIETIYGNGNIEKTSDGKDITDLSKGYVSSAVADALLSVVPEIDKQSRADAGTTSFAAIMDLSESMKKYDDTSNQIAKNADDINKIADLLGIDLGDAKTSGADLKKLMDAAKAKALASNTIGNSTGGLTDEQIKNILAQAGTKGSNGTNGSNGINGTGLTQQQIEALIKEYTNNGTAGVVADNATSALTDAQRAQLASVAKMKKSITTLQSQIKKLQSISSVYSNNDNGGTSNNITVKNSAKNSTDRELKAQAEKIEKSLTTVAQVNDEINKIEENVDQINNNISNLESTLNQTIEDFKTETNNNITNTKEGLEKEIEDLGKEKDEKIEETKNELQSEIDKAKEEAEKNNNATKEELTTLIEKYKTEYDEKIEDITNEYNTKIDNLQSQLTELINQNKDELDAKDSDLQDQIDKNKADYEEKNQQLRDDLNSAVEAEQKARQDGDDALAEQMEQKEADIKQQIADNQAQYEQDKKDLEERLAKERGELDAKDNDLQDQINNLTENFNTEVARIDNTIQTNKTDINNRVDKLESDTEAAMKKLEETFNTRIDNLNSTLTKSISDTNALVQNNTDLININKKDIEANTKLINQYNEELNNNMSTNYTNINKRISDAGTVVIAGPLTLKFDSDNKAVIKSEAFRMGCTGVQVNFQDSSYGITPTYSIDSSEDTGTLTISLSSAPDEPITVTNVVVYRTAGAAPLAEAS